MLLAGSLETDIQGGLNVLTIEVKDFKGIQDGGQLARWELHIHDGTYDLCYLAAQLDSLAL